MNTSDFFALVAIATRRDWSRFLVLAPLTVATHNGVAMRVFLSALVQNDTGDAIRAFFARADACMRAYTAGDVGAATANGDAMLRGVLAALCALGAILVAQCYVIHYYRARARDALYRARSSTSSNWAAATRWPWRQGCYIELCVRAARVGGDIVRLSEWLAPGTSLYTCSEWLGVVRGCGIEFNDAEPGESVIRVCIEPPPLVHASTLALLDGSYVDINHSYSRTGLCLYLEFVRGERERAKLHCVSVLYRRST